MIPLLDFKKAFEYENQFYLSCGSARIGKAMAHYELFKLAASVPGAIVECGVFKGASLSRFAMFRELYGQADSKRLVAFDTFGKFPETGFSQDQAIRRKFIAEAGEESISKDQMMAVLKQKNITGNIELVEGDITKTVPDFVKKNSDFKISLLNLDTDIYEPAVTILEYFFPLISTGGVLILDDYSVFPGETKAVNDYFGRQKPAVRRLPFSATPFYLIKE